MENVQTYIFIVIGLLIAVFSVIRKAKKKFFKERGHTRVPIGLQAHRPVKRDKGFDEWEKWVAEEEVEKKSMRVVPVPVVENKSRANIREPHRSSKTVQKEAENRTNKSPVKFRSKEDIRRAIIYSEIINRKY